jgi:CDP-diglyceride synthetase
MTVEIALRLSGLFTCLFIVGSLLCLPLYKWQLNRFFASTLWTKVVWWLPIYAVFLALCFGGTATAVVVTSGIIIQSIREYRAQQTQPVIARLYLGFFMIATSAITFIWMTDAPEHVTPLLISICFCSVLSDVCAFFLGTYASWHKLPSWINPGKSWEGVAGQIIGAPIGSLFVWLATGITLDWRLVLAIGLASAAGDLFNSAAKRQIGIKDWGMTIPGHGGILDRMSSMSTSFLIIAIVTLLAH